MKKTAINWLVNHIALEGRLPQWLIDKAIEMEKDQIEDAYDSGEANQYSEIYKDGYKDVSPNQYYIETYGKDA